MHHLFYTRQYLGAADIDCCEADIVKAVVGKIPSAVTLRTATLRVEQDESANGLCRNCVLISFDPGVETGTSRHHRSLVGRNRLRDRFRRDPLSGKYRLKQRAIPFNRFQLFDQLVDGKIEFDVGLD